MAEYLSGLESVILQRRDAHPNETFLKWKDEEIAWRDFVDHIYAMAAGFWDAGLRTGDRAAIMMGNCPEFLYTYYAMVFMGVGAVPLNVAQRGEALAYILSDSGASAIVIDEGLVEYFAAIKDLEAKRSQLKNGSKRGGIDLPFNRKPLNLRITSSTPLGRLVLQKES